MIHKRGPGRQPLLWAALALSAGLWGGARTWRPALWWIVAVLAFVVAAVWFLGRRAWMAKGITLGIWFLLGALLIQIRGESPGDPRILALADGRAVLITAHVVRQGYPKTAGLHSLREPIDVETENVESSGEGISVRAGVRLTISERLDPLAAKSNELRPNRSSSDASQKWAGEAASAAELS